MSQVATRVLTEAAVDSPVLPRYEITEWRDRFGVVAGITGRQNDFTLGSAEPSVDTTRMWQRMHAAFGDSFTGVAVSRQRHGRRLMTVKGPLDGFVVTEGLDGHLTREAGILLAITAADCVPVYLVHPESGSIGLVHAGWRGIAQGILATAVSEFCSVAEVPPSDIVMHCGIAICGACYEVGPEVLRALRGTDVSRRERLDLRELLAERAQVAGVGYITVSDRCTAHEAAAFHSHRRSRCEAGRMLAYVGRPAP
jgi:YfiH family protein